MLWRSVALAAVWTGASCYAQRNTQIKREVDISGPIVRGRTAITATGIKRDYVVSLPAELASKLALLSISKTERGDELPYERLPDSDGLSHFAVKGATGDVTLLVKTVFTEALTPFPAEIFQFERQLVLYKDSHYVTSIYPTDSQDTTIKLGVDKVESYTELQPSAQSSKSLVLGPYKDVAGGKGSYSPLTVHLENNAHFAMASTAIREIEVSHWGNVAFEEFLEVHNAGAKLKGGFARVEYMRQEPPWSFRELRALLPSGAERIYYRDQIGNISSSDVLHLRNGVELSLAMRFPLMGGWKTQFYQGYNVPVQDLLTASGRRRTLRVRFSVPFPDMWVRDLTVKVVLPEYAHNVQVQLPFEVDEQIRTSRLTFLDTSMSGGRPVIVLQKKNVVSEHDRELVVTYDFDQAKMLHEPMYLVLAFLAFYLVCMAVVRLDLRLTPDKDSKQKTA